MLKIICLSNNINIIRVNIIVFFSLFLLLGFQCLFDFLNDDISEINNIKKYAILFIIISIIGILSTCLIWEDKENKYVSINESNRININESNRININESNLININEKGNRERELINNKIRNI